MNKANVKQERFIRVAEARTNQIIDMLQHLVKCSNDKFYIYTEEQVERIFNTLHAELEKAHDAFYNKPKRFSLSDDRQEGGNTATD